MARTDPKPPDARAIVAEAILAGESGDSIRSRLVAAGLSEEEARQAEADPLAEAAARLQRRLAKRDWTLEIHGRLSKARNGGLAVPSVEDIEPQRFYDNFYAANLPVLLAGAARDWPAVSKWSLDYFEETVGEAPVEVQGQRESASDYERAKDRHKRVVPMGGVVDLIRRHPTSNDFYVTAYNDDHNRDSLAPLWKDVGELAILRPSGGHDGFLWFGPKGTLTPFHHDLTNNLLVQVMGRKRVFLVPSWEVRRMNNSLHCFSDRSPADW